jgi:HD domain-containing protein/IclR-like helix-turn-helix domain-containing protein
MQSNLPVAWKAADILAMDNRSTNYAAVMASLLAALDLHDDGTGDHVRRVTELGLEIAAKVSPALVADPALRCAFLLHDIGKIGIPDSILRKPGPLAPSEIETLRRHTILGERLLATTRSLPKVVHDVVAYHHEHWDGGGYPYGLRGEEIPLAARIFAVADAFDALTHDRPYRKAVGFPDAMAEIRACSGTQFDPGIVDTFLRAGSGRPPLRLASRAASPETGSAGRLRSRFFTNHGLVLACIAQDRDATVRTIAARVGITQRAAHAIVGDLVRERYVRRTRIGRRNHYDVALDARLVEGPTQRFTLGEFVDVLSAPATHEAPIRRHA